MKKILKKMGCLILSLVIMLSLASITTVNATEATFTTTATGETVTDYLAPTEKFGVYSDTMTTKNTDTSAFYLTNGTKLGYYFVKYDLSNIVFEDLEAVKLKLMGYWSSTHGVSVYEVTKSWNSIDGTYEVSAAPVATAETAHKDSTKYIDLSEYIMSKSDGVSVELMICSTDKTKTSEVQLFRSSAYDAYNNLKLELTYAEPKTKDCEFYKQTTKKVTPTSKTAVYSTSMTEPETIQKFTTFHLIANDSDLYDEKLGRLFLTYDFSDVSIDDIAKVELNLSGYYDAVTSDIVIYKVNEPYDKTTGNYGIVNTPVARVATGAKKTKFTFDLTDYIKEHSEEGSVSLLITSEALPTRKLQGFIYIGYGQNDLSLNITYESRIESLSEIDEDCKLIAKRKVYQGSESEPVNCLPILALFDGTQFVKAEFGESVSLSGSYSTVSCGIDVVANELPITSEAKLFLWNGLDTLVPIEDAQGIFYNQAN